MQPMFKWWPISKPILQKSPGFEINHNFQTSLVFNNDMNIKSDMFRRILTHNTTFQRNSNKLKTCEKKIENCSLDIIEIKSSWGSNLTPFFRQKRGNLSKFQNFRNNLPAVQRQHDRNILLFCTQSYISNRETDAEHRHCFSKATASVYHLIIFLLFSVIRITNLTSVKKF